MNRSKINSFRWWKKWRESGAIGILPLSMEEPKKRLMNLQEHMRITSEVTVLFGRFLARYLSPELVPQGFVTGCEFALHDLQTGINGFTGERIQSSLVGYPPMIYRLLYMEIPRIADAVLPPEFAAGVRAFISQIDKEVQRTKAAA